jgi:hypothetical protein
MSIGYRDSDSNTIYICTECFRLEEIHILLNILRNKLGLIASLGKVENKYLTKWTKNNGFRIRFSRRSNNIKHLKSLVQPHFHSSMLYKLGL